ncbi:MAG: hypothetical protein ABR508_07825 [Candidatus Baltobacteraceae bacterium]
MSSGVPGYSNLVESLTDEQVRALVLRNIKRMDGAHRAQLALFLGHDLSRDPIDEVGRGSADAELRKLVESCALLRERYAAFLRENPSALEPHEPSRRLPFQMKAAALFVLAAVIAIVPLAAQYAQQRGMVSGPQQASIVSFAGPPIVHVHAAVRARRHARAPVQKARAAKPRAVRRPVSAAPRAVARAKAHPHRRARHYRRIANWKFSPAMNPYFSKHWSSVPSPRSPARRARAVVNAYLNDVIHGNRPGAPENAIVSPTTNVRIVSVRPDANARIKVDVELAGPRGHFFEVFSVSRASMRIVDQAYIPINRTAARGFESRNW